MRQKRHLGHISTHFWHGSRPVVIEPSYDFYDVHVHDCSVLGKLEKIEKLSSTQFELITKFIKYEYLDDLNFWFGTNIFYDQSDGFYGQFNNRDNVNLGFEWGF